MPSLEWNEREWGSLYHWPFHGAEWSEVWGGVESQWVATILPRIRSFLPASTLLEIAPGYGRWSNYLFPWCNNYIGVDLAPACVNACSERFQTIEHAHFFVNDGRSLPMIEDRSVDFVFSFDSLVHVEAEVIDSYLSELSRVMSPSAICFLHHSNLGSHLRPLRLARVLEKTSKPMPAARRLLKRCRMVEWDHARAESMTAARFANACQKANLVCVGQEIVDWGHIGRKMIDCLSLVARPGSHWDRPNVVVNNPDFMSEAFSARRVAEMYTTLGVRKRNSTTPAATSSTD
jgi:hypothetical protein